jgi:hypothetical protein
MKLDSADNYIQLSETKAGRIANQIHAARAAKHITLRTAISELEKLSPFLSTAQFTKLMDLQDHARYNPHLLDQ